MKNEHIHKKTLLFTCTGGALSLVLFGALSTVTDWSPVLIGILSLILFGGVAAASYIIVEEGAKKAREGEKKLEPVMGKIMFDAVSKLSSPVFICDSRDRIIWYNLATQALAGERVKLHGENVGELFGLSLTEVRADRSPIGHKFRHGDRSFGARYNHIKNGEDDFSLIMTTETTDIDRLVNQMEEDEVVVAYIYIDNFSEMMQYDSEQYRPASAKVNDVLRAWAAGYRGIFKEYERDKYIFITDMKSLSELIVKRFDVLDKVRSVRVGELNMPLTVSVGVSGIHGTLDEKEKAAHAALDMALQRGGDQAAVKTDDSMEFYGGHTKAVQKRTNVRARVVANRLMAEMMSATNVLIMGHKNADFDAFGSAVGLARLAIHCGSKVNIVIDTTDRNLKKCRTMIEAEEDYKGLFVNSDTALDMLGTGTLVIVADVNNLSISEEPILAEKTERLAIIDHHRKASEFPWEPDIEYIEPSASSTCELVAEMLEQTIQKDTVSAAEASLMLAGITLDTKQFTKNAGTRTFSAAMYLRDRGADPSAVQELFRQSFEDYCKEARFRSGVEIYRDVCAITVVGDTESEDSTTDASFRVIASKAADNLLTVDGIEASFAVIKLGESVHISARSSGKINVQLIMEELGGGGHFDGAAARTEGVTVDELMARLKDAIDKHI